LDAQALVVDRNPHQLRARRGERSAHGRVPGSSTATMVLPRRHQQACEQVERLLRAGGDDDVLRRARDRASEGDVLCDRFAQYRDALRWRIAERGLRPAAQRLRHQATPDVVREERCSGTPRRKLRAGSTRGAVACS
jgi:hypothetical protein